MPDVRLHHHYPRGGNSSLYASQVDIPYVLLVMFLPRWRCDANLLQRASKIEPAARRNNDNVARLDRVLDIFDDPRAPSLNNVIGERALLVIKLFGMARSCLLIRDSRLRAVIRAMCCFSCST